MAELGITINPTIVKNGGPITSDVYKSHATNRFTKGTLLKLASGLLTPCVDTSAASAEIDTDDTGTTGVRLFLALEDHLTAGSVFIAVQELRADTIIEAQILASGSTAPTAANIAKGTSYTGYQIDTGTHQGSGLWGIDVDDTTKPVFNVVDVSSNYNPHDPKAKLNHAKVLVKVLSAILA
jgi:hypothetical protein